jgi:hypothetical protein
MDAEPGVGLDEHDGSWAIRALGRMLAFRQREMEQRLIQ